ncbi:MAG: sulfite exporter TauE/SafE family protein, partial [Myxococcota bacterium]
MLLLTLGALVLPGTAWPAAGSGGAANGALVMSAFWLGTLPVMLAVGVGLQALAGPLR